MNLRAAKCISISKRSLQRRKKGRNDFNNVIFGDVFCQNYRQQSKNKVSTSYKTVLSCKIFPKQNLVRSFGERSILAVPIGKFGPLRESIRKLFFSVDQFSHVIKQNKHNYRKNILPHFRIKPTDSNVRATLYTT